MLLSGAGPLLAGCSTGGAGTASSGAARSAAGAPAAAAAGDGHKAAFGASGSANALLSAAGHSIIYTASLTIDVRDAAAAAAKASAAVSAAGGYTAGEQARTSQARRRQRPQVSLTLKIPVAAYPATLRRLAGLGRQTSLSQQSSDVTQQVADVNSRVTSLRDAITQLRRLLRRAGSITSLLQVQNQIAGDESDLESLLAQQRALDHETTYATVTMQLLGPRPHTAAPAPHRWHGFTGGLGAGWRGLGHAGAWLATALGLILPFALALAVLGGLGYAGWHRYARRRARPTEAA
ncbi:MAG TPA: DUF4349 domain-containing protein [Streptosporangiaceae bacterium]|nr:DUF4349 domain-containing protein [Streptosporangiaceae bacterium]